MIEVGTDDAQARLEESIRYRAALEQISALRGYKGSDPRRVRSYTVAAEIAEEALAHEPKAQELPVPQLYAVCAYCEQFGSESEDCAHPVEDLRWNGDCWCCEECGAGGLPEGIWESWPRFGGFVALVVKGKVA